MSDKNKNLAKSVGFIAVLAVVAVCVLYFSAFFVFRSKARKTLSQTAQLKYLEFESNLKTELLLAVQMAKSPTIVEYMKTPSDPELSKRAQAEIYSFQESFKGKNSFSISDNDLLYYSNGKVLYTLDKSDPANSWFDSCLALSDPYTFIVSYDIALKKNMLWVDAIVRDETGKGIGLIGTGINLTDFVDQTYRNLDSSLTMFFYNMDKEITGATDVSLLENHALITSQLQELGNAGNLFPSAPEIYSTSKGEYILYPVPSVNWTMVIFQPYNLSQFFGNAIVPLAAILILVFFTLVALMGVHLVHPLNEVKETVDSISQGNADLTRRLDVNVKTTLKVIPAIVNGFNGFIAKLQAIIGTVKVSKDNLSASGSRLHSCIDDTVSSIELLNSNIGGMSSSIGRQTDSVSATVQAVNRISGNIETLNRMVVNQSETVHEASSAIEQMVGNIQAVNNSIEEMSKSFTGLDENADLGMSKLDEVNSRISQIQEQSEMLQNANLIISSIAEQTNLLAMNAAIEAAHAGDAGKGFSVVADEIRKLSENSSAQSKTISEQLNTIQDSITGIVEVSKESQTSFAEVSHKLHSTGHLGQQITTSMAEQTQGSALIGKSLDSLNSSSREVVTASGEMSEGNKTIMQEIQALQETTASIQRSMNGMTSDAQQMDRTRRELSAISDEMNGAITEISREIDLFKV